MIGFFFFVLGLIVGSFLNVVIIRFGSGKSFLHGRSQCMSCGKDLVWFELIPLVSFLSLKGRCRKCKTKISWQYPVVEFFTGVLFFLFASFDTQNFSTFSIASILALAFHLLFASLLVFIFVYDIRHLIIPDRFSILLFLTGICSIIVDITFGGEGLNFAYSRIASALVISLFLWGLWKISRGTWMGLGDSKLTLGLGLLTPLPQGLSGFAFAFWIGAGVSLIRMFVEHLRGDKKRITMKTEIPFAPFLILGILIAFFFESNVFNFTPYV